MWYNLKREFPRNSSLTQSILLLTLVVSPSRNRHHQPEVPPNAATVFATAFLKAMGRQLPSSQVTRGDIKLKQACGSISGEVQSKIAENDLKVIQNKINL